MSEPNPGSQFESNFGPSLSNAGVSQGLDGPSFRNSVPSTSTANMGPPALPPRPDMAMQPSYGMNSGYNGGMGTSYGMGTYGMGGYGSYGGMGGYGSYGGYGMGMGGMYGMNGGYNRFGPGMYGGDIESRFIQMAEDSSRPAFESIQSLVNAVGSVAMMLENTFFALTSSFRAILGVAENFGRLRSLFAQFWSTFTVIRSINWLIRKLMVILGIRTESEFKAWAEAVAATQQGTATPDQQAKGSSWPVLLFFGVIAAAPYIVFKMLSGLSSSINERLIEPTTWKDPLRAVAHHDFQATSPQEISFIAGQVLTVAPQNLQGHYWNSGWLMASTDRKNAGLVPVNYIKVIKPQNQIQPTESQSKPAQIHNEPGQSHEQSQSVESKTDVNLEPSLADMNKFYGDEL